MLQVSQLLQVQLFGVVCGYFSSVCAASSLCYTSAARILYSTTFPFYLRKYLCVFWFTSKSKYFIKILFYVVYFYMYFDLVLAEKTLVPDGISVYVYYITLIHENTTIFQPHSYLLHSDKKGKHIQFAYICTGKCLYSQIFFTHHKDTNH